MLGLGRTIALTMEPREYRLKVGQGYRWKIKASDQSEYAFVAPAFFRNIWIRKVEAGDVEIKAAILDEIEFESGGEAELFFVAVRPGTYDFGSRGFDGTRTRGENHGRFGGPCRCSRRCSCRCRCSYRRR